VQQIRNERTKHFHKGESHKISPYAYYFYSIDLGKYLTRIVEKHNDKYEVEMLMGHKNKDCVSFRFDYIKEGMMQMAKYLVDNKTAITTRLKENKKPTLYKLEKEKVRLYKSLDGLALSERLETYGQISDVRLRIEKLAKLSEMIDGYINIARKLSKKFDIVLAKQLFSSFVVQDFSFNLMVSISIEGIICPQTSQSQIYSFTKSIKYLFKTVLITFSLHII
jgi:hypothetical protein